MSCQLALLHGGMFKGKLHLINLITVDTKPMHSYWIVLKAKQITFSY